MSRAALRIVAPPSASPRAPLNQGVPADKLISPEPANGASTARSRRGAAKGVRITKVAHDAAGANPVLIIDFTSPVANGARGFVLVRDAHAPVPYSGPEPN